MEITKLSNFLQKFCPDIYSADETGLFYLAMPDHSLSYKRSSIWFKESNGLCNCCAVQTCYELINRSCWLLGSWCFKGIRMDSLPDMYSANKSVWITSVICKKWPMSWDLELQQKLKKILRVLDNCVAHPYLDSLKNNRLEFLHPSTMSLVQPIDKEITKNLKTLYHMKLVNYMLEAIQENLLT
jgi:hypothetical protein